MTDSYRESFVVGWLRPNPEPWGSEPAFILRRIRKYLHPEVQARVMLSSKDPGFGNSLYTNLE